MGALNNLMLGHVLRKLTDVFEVMLITSKSTAPQAAAIAQAQQRKTSAKMPYWLRCLRSNTPLQVTHVLFQHMHQMQKIDRQGRFEAQSALLELLVEEGLAISVVEYSVHRLGEVNAV
ncbi:MAG: hypothetical protein PW845_21445 [Pseudomonas sp.]|nr:hypothetical protein [Pseudomonas sp.]